MIRFETLNEVACLKDSEAVIRKINDILSFVSDMSAKGEVYYPSFTLKDNLLEFGLSVSIPFHCQQSSE